MPRSKRGQVRVRDYAARERAWWSPTATHAADMVPEIDTNSAFVVVPCEPVDLLPKIRGAVTRPDLLGNRQCSSSDLERLPCDGPSSDEKDQPMLFLSLGSRGHIE